MEQLIRTILSKYNRYLAEEKLLNRWLSNRDNPEMRQELVLLDMKIASVQSWFNLLNEDERFVIQKHLLEELDWPRVAYAFSERWQMEFSRTERTLLYYQSSALKKIDNFCKCHKEIIFALFGDLEDEQEKKKG